MLTLIESGFGYTGHSELIRRIEETVAGDRRGFLIVPEQKTVSSEGEIAKRLPPSCALSFEVTNFTRFANYVFRTLGGLAGEVCDASREALIMWRTLTELSPILSFTAGKRDINFGAVEKMLLGVRELESLGIDGDALSDIDTAGLDGRLKAKISDLALVYPLYKRLLHEKYQDGQDLLFLLAKKLDGSPDFLSGAEIYIEDFTSFTEPQYRVLSRLIKRCSVSLLLPLPRHNKDDFIYTEIRKTRERLIREANLSMTPVKTLRIGEFEENHTRYISELSDALWHSYAKIDNSYLQKDCVRIFEADTPFDECDFIAADILERVRGGASFSDIAVIAAHAEGYVGIIDTAFNSAGIAHFISKRRDIFTFEAIKLISTAYSVITRGFAPEDVIAYSKLALSDITRDEADELELYIEKWNISSRLLCSTEPWNMNPRGYTEMSDADREKLISLNSARERLLFPILDFEEKASSAKTVREHASLLVDFLTGLRLENKLLLRAAELSSLGENAEAEENERLWQLICDALDALVDTLGASEVNAETFSKLLSVVFSHSAVTKIPSHADEVLIGSADMLRLRGKSHVYLIGVNEGLFPAAVKENTYFTDKDRVQLSRLGFNLEGDLEAKNARELFTFTRAFASAEKTVTLTTTRKSSSFTEVNPSSVIAHIEELTEGKVKKKNIDELSPLTLISSPASVLNKIGSFGEEYKTLLKRALDECGFGEEIRLAEGSSVNDALSLTEKGTALLYGNDIYLSQTRIDSFLSCPLGYFLKYNLKLDERAPAELGANVIGSFIHSILEHFFLELRRIGKDVGTLGEEERAAITERAARSYISSSLGDGYKSKRTEVAIARLKRAALPVIDGLCEEFSDCRFTPVFFELKTDKSSDVLPDPVVFTAEDGTRAIINGTVDRVDAFSYENDTYVRVIDYKTGSKSFSPSDIDEGRNLQMFLYLKAITETEKPAFRELLGAKEGGRLVPAGVIYVKTRVKDVTLDLPDDALAVETVKSLQERDGMLLDDEVAISAMNKEYLPIKFKEGEIAEGSKKYLYSESSWEKIGDRIHEIIDGVCSDMRSGKIPATSTDKNGNSSCTFCSFRSVCRSPSKKEMF